MTRELLDCHIDLVWFPFDQFSCNVTYRSSKHIHSFPTSLLKLGMHQITLFPALPSIKLILNWLDQDNLNYLSNAEEEYIDVQRRGWLVNQPVRLNQSITKRKGSKTEIYSELIYQLTFTRQTWSEIMQTFIPSIMLSLASASSLYIDYSQLPARMGLAATSFLSLIALFKGSSEKWPQTAYLKAIDVWTLLSYFGAFFCLVEYAFVLHVSNKLHKITSVVS